jgi:hypothetical protein
VSQSVTKSSSRTPASRPSRAGAREPRGGSRAPRATTSRDAAGACRETAATRSRHLRGHVARVPPRGCGLSPGRVVSTGQRGVPRAPGAPPAWVCEAAGSGRFEEGSGGSSKRRRPASVSRRSGGRRRGRRRLAALGRMPRPRPAGGTRSASAANGRSRARSGAVLSLVPTIRHEGRGVPEWIVTVGARRASGPSAGRGGHGSRRSARSCDVSLRLRPADPTPDARARAASSSRRLGAMSGSWRPPTRRGRRRLHRSHSLPVRLLVVETAFSLYRPGDRQLGWTFASGRRRASGTCGQTAQPCGFAILLYMVARGVPRSLFLVQAAPMYKL